MSAKVMLLEIASVLAIIGSAAAIAIPKTGEIQSAREATTLADDVESVRAAVFAFHEDSTYFPAEAPLGDIPVGLEPYLPARFSFRRAWGTIEYKNWPAVVASHQAAEAPDSVVAGTAARDTRVAAPVRVGVPVDSALAALAPMTRNPAVRVPTITPMTTATATPAPRDSTVGARIIGVSVTARDPRVGLIAARRARRMARFVVGDKVTFVLFGA